MMKKKLTYSEAEIEIMLLSSDDIICTSGDPDDMSNIPGNGDSWDGWA